MEAQDARASTLQDIANAPNMQQGPTPNFDYKSLRKTKQKAREGDFSSIPVRDQPVPSHPNPTVVGPDPSKSNPEYHKSPLLRNPIPSPAPMGLLQIDPHSQPEHNPPNPHVLLKALEGASNQDLLIINSRPPEGGDIPSKNLEPRLQDDDDVHADDSMDEDIECSYSY